MKADCSTVIKYFDLIDEFIRVRSANDEILQDLQATPPTNKAAYRRRVVEVCIPDYASSVARSVADSVVEELRASVDEKETITVESPIQPGDQVDVVDGPMRGQQVTVSCVLPGAQRVRVLLEFLGSKHEIEVSILSLLSIRDPRSGALPPSADT